MNFHGHEANADADGPISSAPDELRAIAVALRSLWHELVAGMHQPRGPEGPQRQQFWVLRALAEGPQRMSDLAEQAQTSQASLTGIVDRLEERGLVERCRSSEDRRVVEVLLTEKGRSDMRASHALMLKRLDDVLAPLSVEERETLASLLGRVSSSAETGTCCHQARSQE